MSLRYHLDTATDLESIQYSRMASPIPSSPHSTAQRWPVEECARPNAEILSFGCEIPTDMSFAPTDPDDAAAWPRPVHHHHRSTDNPSQQQGVVGIITMLGRQTVMIWFGWGGIGQEVTTTVAPLDPVRSVGSGGWVRAE